VFWWSDTTHYRIAALYYEWNDKKGVEEHVQQALQMSELFTPGIEACIQAARFAWMCGESGQAFAWLDKAEEQTLQSSKQQHDLLALNALRVQYRLAEGDIDAATDCYERFAVVEEERLDLFERDVLCQMRARLLIAQGSVEEAADLLGVALQGASERGHVHSEIALLVQLVRAYYAAGDIRQTKQALERVLALAETGGYCRVFLDEGEMMGLLLAEIYHRQQKRCAGEWPLHTFTYVRTLLSAFSIDVEPRGLENVQKRGQSPLDQLSEREQDVLRLIAAGHTNQQIAHTLVVAESTIKTHLNNIYAKLHVNSRLQALTQAHAFGLLER
jgi:LuxR family maltose regulon positive regulatory protein